MENTQPPYDVTLELTISNDAGVLGRVCSMIGDTGANISDLVFVDRKPDFFKIEISIDLSDIEHLHSVLSRLEAETEVAMTKRLRRSETGKDGTLKEAQWFSKRRERPAVLDRIYRAMWPKGGWTRAFHYVRHRLRRLPDTPERIARGIWAGVFVTFTPFYGMHFHLCSPHRPRDEWQSSCGAVGNIFWQSAHIYSDWCCFIENRSPIVGN
jgi:hypothetical protein